MMKKKLYMLTKKKYVCTSRQYYIVYYTVYMCGWLMYVVFNIEWYEKVTFQLLYMSLFLLFCKPAFRDAYVNCECKHADIAAKMSFISDFFKILHFHGIYIWIYFKWYEQSNLFIFCYIVYICYFNLMLLVFYISHGFIYL